MIKVYGQSDDLVEIEGSKYAEDEIGCWESYVRLWFADGAIIQVSYGKGGEGIWMICAERKGSGHATLTECNDQDADTYSDTYETDAEILRHDVVYIESTSARGFAPRTEG